MLLLLVATGIFLFTHQSVLLEDYILYGEGIPVIGGTTTYWSINGLDGDIKSTDDNVNLIGYSNPRTDDCDLNNPGVAETVRGFKNVNVRVNIEAFNPQQTCGYSQSTCNMVTSYEIYFDNKLVVRKSVSPQGRDGGLLEIVPSIINKSEYTVVYQGIIVEIVKLEGEGKLKFVTNCMASKLKIRDLRWKPLFNCQVDNDETIVTDEFSQGTKFSIKDLSYTATKFCLDSYPATVRSTTAQGVATDIKGDLTRKLAKGESITVKKDQVVSISYFTKATDVLLRCKSGETFNTATNKCQSLLPKGVKPVPITKIVNNITVIIPGKNQAVIKTAGRFDNGWIEIANVTYNCYKEYPEANYKAPNPKPTCWRGTINTPLVSQKTTHGVAVSPNKYYTVTPYFTSKWESDKENCGGSTIIDGTGCIIGKADLVFEWVDYNAIQFKLINNTYNVSLNKPAFMHVNLINNFGLDFNNKQTGFLITETRDLIFGQKRYDYMIGFSKGDNTLKIPVDTSLIGEVKYELVPFISVGGFHGDDTRLFDDEKQTLTFFVESGSIKAETNYEKDTATKVKDSVKNFDTTKIALTGIIIFLLLIILTLIITNLKKITKR